ncbi:MAG: hypothetical protein LW854_06340 [Rubrivivax sp.]|jgi:hypothetical protein|nr:hypothetical protein [Rubrivivax sp.]
MKVLLLLASHVATLAIGFALGIYALHWGEGRVSVSAQAISLDGQLAPGPDYKL